MFVETLQHGIPEPSNDGWIAMIFLAIFSTVISYVWFADGILTIGAGKVHCMFTSYRRLEFSVDFYYSMKIRTITTCFIYSHSRRSNISTK